MFIWHRLKSQVAPERMERGKIFSKITKVEIPSDPESMSSGGAKSTSGLQRQSSATKSNCLCSPTSHAGSFRCRLHRARAFEEPKASTLLHCETLRRRSIPQLVMLAM
ncbi:Tubulin glycylase [Salix suchowensis]|nr:Tubulin glycylase [Salix suchowensis]